jgi:hypothetical protein
MPLGTGDCGWVLVGSWVINAVGGVQIRNARMF